MVLAYNTMVIS